MIIDCDPGIDDALALLLAFANCDVSLVCTEPGNQNQEQSLENALVWLSYLGQEVEVARGLEAPLQGPLKDAGDIHGKSSLANLQWSKPSLSCSKRSAIDAMRASLEEKSQVIVATGPLSNIAALITAHPWIKQRIEYISLMGGAATSGNVTPFAEFNFHADPLAAKIVFSSQIPIVMSGLDVTHKAYLTLAQVREIENMGSDLAKRVAAMLRFYVKSSKNTAFLDTDFEGTVRMHDICAVSWVISPEIFKGQDCFVDIETRGLARGASFVDYRGKTGKAPNAKVLHSIDRNRLIEQLKNAILKKG